MKKQLQISILEELLDLLKAADPVDRESAIMRLNFYCNDLRVVEPLLEALDDVDARVRAAAAHRLGVTGNYPEVAPAARKAVNRLVALLEDENVDVVASAIYALGKIGDSSVGSELLPFLDYPDTPHVKVRRITIESLGALRYQPAIPHLCRLLHDAAPEVRHDAILALFSMRHISRNVKEVIRLIADDPDSPLHNKAQKLIEIIIDEENSCGEILQLPT